MTKRELLDKLADQPDDVTVVVADGVGEYVHILNAYPSSELYDEDEEPEPDEWGPVFVISPDL